MATRRPTPKQVAAERLYNFLLTRRHMGWDASEDDLQDCKSERDKTALFDREEKIRAAFEKMTDSLMPRFKKLLPKDE